MTTSTTIHTAIRLLPIILGTLILTLVLGCSNGAAGPVSGGLTEPSGSSAEPTAGRVLWGYWQGVVDPDAGDVEFTVLRGCEFHVNVVGQLQPPKPAGLAVAVNDIDPVNGTVDLNLTITHPFPNSNFRGFDVRGIVMGAGDVISSKSDATAVYAAPDGFRVENADGCTRWWNPQEFGTPGFYGFVTGALGSKTLKPLTTLNGYKYFSDPLGPTDPIAPKVNTSNRGTFSTAPNPSLTRNYVLQFPIIGGKPVWTFQYAVDANWAPPTGGSPKPKPVGDYPLEANCPEAYNILVDSSESTAWYVDGTNLGGDLKLGIEVFDWGAPSNLAGIDGEIGSIQIESETLFPGVVTVPVDSTPGNQPTSGVYWITVPNVHPTGLENQEVLVTVRSKSPTKYQPPISGPEYPKTAQLAAYEVYEVPILNVNPEENNIHVDVPNGGEVWNAGGAYDITWTSTGTVGDNVKIEYSIAGGAPTTIVTSTANDGLYHWDPLPQINSNQVKVKITSVENPLIWDESDNNFTIGVVGTIHVVSPNGGETLAGGGKWDIQWTSAGPVDNVKIDLSLDGGTTYPQTIIDSTPDTGIYTWDPVPFVNKNDAMIKITSVEDATVFDESDAVFSITEMGDSITVILPNGGETLQAGGSYEIRWSFTGGIGDVKIDFSTDSGSTWPTSITSGTPCTGSFVWDPVPDIETTTARIRISTMTVPQVKDTSDGDFTITSEPISGWNPVSGQTRVALTNPAPMQLEEPVDLAVFSAGENQSRGEIVNQATDSIFYKYNDAYTATTGSSWTYPVADFGPIHKFDVLPDGSYIFVTLAGTTAWGPPQINDPAYGIFSSHNNETGEASFLFLGDSGDPDPEQQPWWWMPDFSCGVPGGTEDNRAYLLAVHSPDAGNPVPPDGNIALLLWDPPYDGTSLGGWFLSISTNGGSVGLVDDSAPGSMALAVDDATGVGINNQPATGLWILDSAGKVQSVLLVWATGDVALMDPALTSEQYGSRTPVDVEIANATDFGYSVTDPGFNWLAVLLNNGNGTWSVGVWEFNYLAGPPATFTQIDITDPIPGRPMALDVDPVDFEIHVLSKSEGKVEATVFDYLP